MSNTQNKQNIEVGDLVSRTYAWQSDERPTNANFKTGIVTNVFFKDMGDDVKLLKFEIEGVGIADADRVRLIEKREVSNVRDLPVYVRLDERKCDEALATAQKNGWRGFITANNFDHTEFEVESFEASYKVRLRYANATDDIGGNCECAHFKHRKQMCKHLAYVAIKEVYEWLEVRMAA